MRPSIIENVELNGLCIPCDCRGSGPGLSCHWHGNGPAAGEDIRCDARWLGRLPLVENAVLSDVERLSS